ncbi:hypothetical protein PV11_07886 [Exophiala sideris]|uniref:AAA+ ATPase domain-containing protein n=1 Tax=Exophiala sideris TaxID=1016849 RepID=A0A0D1VVV8_9EURO|nr:hypothetical protein PV11_07886 [Exophiala sideris]
MRSALQAELRFSQILTSTCRHCARRQASRTRSFHTASRFRAPQEPPNNTSSGIGHGLGVDKSSHSARAEVAPENASEEKNALLTQSNSKQEEPAPSDDGASAESRNLYRSAGRGRMRRRMSKASGDVQNLSNWFLDNNITLYGEKPLVPSRDRPTVQKVPADLVTGEPLELKKPDDLRFKTPLPPPPQFDGIVGGSTTSVHEPASRNEKEPQSSKAEEILFTRSRHHSTGGSTRYYIIAEQFEEAERTARGLLLMPEVKGSLIHDSESIKEHLLLQYAGKDGDLLLDNVVEDLARHLACDLLVLDAHDIANLITRPGLEGRIMKEGRNLSYDVYNAAFSDTPNNGQVEANENEDDDEEDTLDDLFGESSEGPPRRGMPVMIGKLDLKSMFGVPGERRRSRSGSSRARPIGDVFSYRTEGDFKTAVQSLFTSLADRQNLTKRKPRVPNEMMPELGRFRETTAKMAGVPKGATIIHVKDLESIQETSIGLAFLQDLYQGVSKRRKLGEPLLLIGTDSLREGEEPFTKERIEELQKGYRDEISQNVVITPVLPTTRSKLALLDDRKRRIATINMRHLWEMMEQRKPSIFAHLEPGFWHRDFLKKVDFPDQFSLEAKIWSYSYVQRLANYIAGSALLHENTIPGITDKKELQESLRAVHGDSEYVIAAATASLRHSDKTKARWAEKEKASKEVMADTPNKPKSPGERRIASIRASASRYEKRLMGGIVEAKNINTTFNDVHMPAETIDTLQTLTTLSLVRPDAFKYGVLASDKIPGLLLYGPPGTGKTLAAKAVAKESGATMLEVSAADINDMYVGEGEKNVKALFSLAKKLSPCVVFLDEADAMFSARSTQGRRASHRELLNQFLREWDGMSNDSGSAFIMVATNRPMDLDDAVLRRLPRRLLVDLPTELDRLEILKIHLRQEQLASDVDIADLAKRTPFYSGSDLKNVAVAAALNCVREENELAKKHQGEEPYQHAERRTLHKRHFDKALEDISASISEDMSSLRDIKKFDEQFGDKRGKSKKTPRLGFPTQHDDRKRDTKKVRA